MAKRISMKEQSQATSFMATARYPRGRTLLCRLDFHSGPWYYDAHGNCGQTRACQRCGRLATRLKHVWDGGWRGGGLLRKCLRCSATDLRGTLGELYHGLEALGVDPTPSPTAYSRTRDGGEMVGLISVRKSPIAWAALLAWRDSEGVTYVTDYGVPTSGRLTQTSFRSVRVRTFPIFGRVTEVRWQGNGVDQGARVRLANDGDLKDAIISASAEVAVRTSPSGECWLITHGSADAPSAEVWKCYEKVAAILGGKTKADLPGW
jgi:hypothetical protein